MEKNYDHLIGKVIEVTAYDHILGEKLLIIAIDLEVGITMVDNDDHSVRRVCLMHPDIYKAKNGVAPSKDADYYKLVFDFIVSNAEKGYYDATPRLPEGASPGGDGTPLSADSCAFS